MRSWKKLKRSTRVAFGFYPVWNIKAPDSYNLVKLLLTKNYHADLTQLSGTI